MATKTLISVVLLFIIVVHNTRLMVNRIQYSCRYFILPFFSDFVIPRHRFCTPKPQNSHIYLYYRNYGHTVLIV